MNDQLLEAACVGDVEAVEKLLEAGSDVNSRHPVNGWTALHWAAKRNHLKVVEVTDYINLRLHSTYN